MFQTLKGIFAPKSILGLQIGASHIAAVQVSSPGHSPVVDRMIYQEVSEPGRLFTDLEQLFQREDLHPEVVVTSIPTGEATIREIRVDIQNYRQLDKIIKYQLEPHVPYPIEDIVVDFFPSEQKGSVLTVGVRKETISDHLSRLSEIQIVPQLVTLEDVALFFLLAKHPDGPGNGAVAVFHGSGPRKVVQVVRNGHLDFIRVFPGSGDIRSQLQESMLLYAMKNQGPVKEILITGRSALEEASPEWVAKATGVPASVWNPFARVRHEFGDLSPDAQARMSVPLGLALSAANGARRFNLRKEEFVFKESLDLRSLFAYMLCALVLFLGLFTFKLQHEVSTREAVYDALNVKISQIFQDTFPGTPNVVRGKEAVQMAQKISAETEQYQWLEEAGTQGSMLETLRVLSQRLSGFGDVQVDNLSLESGRIGLDGRTSSFKTVDDLKARLGEPGPFKSAKLVSAKMDSREQAVLFNLVLEKSR
ncbi:MAG: hypothetical protein C4576_05715 [Desulfobacteraceae bacterium]|nr:MAG: hypothetical protein C4576_05715 [Desulfobacteraceae bacterium]